MTPQEIIDHVAHVLLRGITTAQAEALDRALGPNLDATVRAMCGSQLDTLLRRLGAGRSRWPPEGWPDFGPHCLNGWEPDPYPPRDLDPWAGPDPPRRPGDPDPWAEEPPF